MLMFLFSFSFSFLFALLTQQDEASLESPINSNVKICMPGTGKKKVRFNSTVENAGRWSIQHVIWTDHQDVGGIDWPGLSDPGISHHKV